jgi:hypothetical protein
MFPQSAVNWEDPDPAGDKFKDNFKEVILS